MISKIISDFYTYRSVNGIVALLFAMPIDSNLQNAEEIVYISTVLLWQCAVEAVTSIARLFHRKYSILTVAN